MWMKYQALFSEKKKNTVIYTNSLSHFAQDLLMVKWQVRETCVRRNRLYDESFWIYLREIKL